MDEDKQREIASKGGKASGGNFANDPERASKAGKKGAAAQPTEAKRRGGQNSHRND
jgi:general stress protein YciG